MDDCLFCRIGRGELPAAKVFDDGDVFAIEDLHPQAPVHLLVIPHVHRTNAGALGPADGALAARLVAVAAELGGRLGSGGYRLVVNTGPQGGQTVGHLHLHVLAGRPMAWPPG